MLGVLSQSCCEILLLLNIADMDSLLCESCECSAECRAHLVGIMTRPTSIFSPPISDFTLEGYPLWRVACRNSSKTVLALLLLDARK